MRYFISLLFVTVATIYLTGCEKHLMPTDYSLAAITPPEPAYDINAGQKEAEPAVLPEVWNYIPADNRENIFHKLLGENTDVYFEKNQKGETFAAFTPESNDLQALAQVRKVGNEDGFVLVFAGINCQSQPPVINGVYTFEYGEPMTGIDLYSQKKDGFLQKFTGNKAGEKLKVDTITGATMICDPLSKEINDISKNLFEINNNTNAINNLLKAGKKMSPADIADESVVIASEINKHVVVKDVSPIPAVKDGRPATITIKPEKNIAKKPGIEKMFQDNADKVATIEIILVSLATGIIIGTTATNRRRK